jgi:hypothetical protein
MPSLTKSIRFPVLRRTPQRAALCSRRRQASDRPDDGQRRWPPCHRQPRGGPGDRRRERSPLRAFTPAVKTALSRKIGGRHRIAARRAVDKVKMLAEQARRETRHERVTLPVEPVAGNAATGRISQQRLDFIRQIR